jgi:hypothetical protein
MSKTIFRLKNVSIVLGIIKAGIALVLLHKSEGIKDTFASSNTPALKRY